MNKSFSPVQLFLRHFLPLAFLIIVLASCFWIIERHGHQQFLAESGLRLTADQYRLLMNNFYRHQHGTIGVISLIALLIAALIAWHAAKNWMRQIRIEDQNRQQLRNIKLLLNSTLEGIYAIDTQGCCIMANRACAQLLGYDSPNDLLGKQLHELMHHTRADGTPYPLHDCKVHRIIEGGSAIYLKDEVFWRRDGSALPVAYSAHPIEDDGQVIGMVCTFVDLTEQKQAEAQMKLLEEQLCQSRKMEAIGQLASGVAHDFNNILQVISGNAQLIELIGADEPQTLHKRTDEIIKAVERGVTLTKAMLAFARKQPIALRPLDLNQLLLETEPLARNLLNKQHRLFLRLTSEPMPVTADATLLQQVLFNLVTNARDAMPEGGTVTIGTALTWEVPPQATDQKTISEAPYVIFWVQDTGQGIGDEIRDKIFEPFFTTKAAGKGTGLGLAMVYGTIKQHNGFIKLDSAPGHGSTFTLYLPACLKETCNS